MEAGVRVQEFVHVQGIGVVDHVQHVSQTNDAEGHLSSDIFLSV